MMRGPRTIGIATAMIAVFLGAPSAAAQPNSWSEPELIFAFGGDQQSRIMSLTSDASDRLHLFVPVTESGKATIQYASWESDLWTAPVDILATSNSRPAFLDSEAVWDGARRLYLLQGDGSTYFSDLGEPPSAASWQPGPPYSEGMTLGVHAVGHDGGLHVAYSVAARDGGKILFRSLLDGAFTPPTTVSHLVPGRTADWPRLAVDSLGRWHVVWTELQAPNGWPPFGVYYARSEDQGETWSAPTEIAAGQFDLINVAVAPDDVVHVAWLGAAGEGGRFHRYSADGGATWSPAVTIVESGATNGFPRFAFDSTGTPQLVFVSEITTYHTSWSPSGWSEPQPLMLSDQQVADRGGGSPGGEWSQFAITGGNRLHVLFKASGGIWHTSRTLPLDERPPQPTPEALPLIDLVSAPVTNTLKTVPAAERPPPTEMAAPTAAPDPHLDDMDYGPVSNSFSPAAIVGGVLATAVLVAFLTRRRP